MQPALLVENLTKTYTRRKRVEGRLKGLWSFFSPSLERHEALRGLDFRIERGESVGLIGENGAGKSTTVKVLTGILVPSGGRVETLGLNPWKQRRKLAPNIGVTFGQKPQLLWDIPAAESFKLLKAMYGIPDEVYRYTYGEAVERLELASILRTPVRLLSLGQRMRCDVAASLLHAPKVAFLDEPTIGLDVLVKERVREHLKEMRRRFGTTVLLTTHDLKDISITCERLIVLDKGQLLYDGSLGGFQQRFGGERSIVIQLASGLSVERAASLREELTSEGAELSVETPHRLRVTCPGAQIAPKVTGLLLQRLEVSDLLLQEPDIEAIIARLYRSEARPA